MYLNVFCSYKHAHMHSSRCAYLPVSDCMFLRNTCTYIKMGGWFYCAKSAVRRRMKISRVAPGRVATHADGTGVPRARKWQAPKTSRASATRALTTSRSRAGLVAGPQLHNRLLAKNDLRGEKKWFEDGSTTKTESQNSLEIPK